MGLGYGWVMVAIAALRELLGAGTFLGMDALLRFGFQPILFFTLPPGGFLVFALLISFNLWLKRIVARSGKGA
jgi:electron transport complex protein RnfE